MAAMAWPSATARLSRSMAPCAAERSAEARLSSSPIMAT
jgi:hypothetical protein